MNLEVNNEKIGYSLFLINDWYCTNFNSNRYFDRISYDREMAFIMRILVACEFSGIVREEFSKLGHDAWSCDLLPTEIDGNHFQCNVFEIIDMGWDLMIAHPPCTFLTVSGNRWYKENPSRYFARLNAAEFFFKLALCSIPKIAIENPIGIMSGFYRKPDQIIQPWQFGHGEVKGTCLWIKNLPNLIPSNIVEGREQRIWKMGPNENRWRERSRTFPGIAKAMADQWGNS